MKISTAMNLGFKTQEGARKASEAFRGYNGSGRTVAVFCNGVERFFALGAMTSGGCNTYGRGGRMIPVATVAEMTGY